MDYENILENTENSEILGQNDNCVEQSVAIDLTEFYERQFTHDIVVTFLLGLIVGIMVVDILTKRFHA